ncbi:hypothetical protein LMG29542_08100 [Paraburkholderia humisilvae]|uniref:Uncharacterized protein n=1 Tax=Paraburkholderia humisilvae TaxID=627669 RepID=A0A6J5FAL2_9BURK|nr:hypothetical protein LMG29542_08100 [Paraburkholderia humisilvae]
MWRRIFFSTQSLMKLKHSLECPTAGHMNDADDDVDVVGMPYLSQHVVIG